MPEWWLALNSHWINIWIQHFGLIEGRARRAKRRVMSALHSISVSKFWFRKIRETSVLCQKNWRGVFIGLLTVYECIYVCVYNIYRSCTGELCQKDSCFQTAFHPVNVGTVSSYCLVPTGGHWSIWEALMLLGRLVPNASLLAVPKLQKISYWPISTWPGTLSLWRRFKLVRMQQL